jgi:hypothetical protein
VVSDRGTILDTVKLTRPSSSILKKTSKKQQEQQKLTVSSNLNTGNLLDYFKPLILKSPYPLKKYRLNGIILIENKDTLTPEVKISDTIERYITINHTLKEDHKYRLIIPDTAFTDIMDNTNDSLQISFKTTSPGDYSKMKIDVELTIQDMPYIIQLVDDKDNVIAHTYITASSEIEFDQLKPGKYRLKAIQDSNLNKRWDAGIYLRILQPEKVIFFDKSFDLHANWMDEETWRL